jgi:hypothetical protein
MCNNPNIYAACILYLYFPTFNWFALFQACKVHLAKHNFKRTSDAELIIVLGTIQKQKHLYIVKRLSADINIFDGFSFSKDI